MSSLDSPAMNKPEAIRRLSCQVQNLSRADSRGGEIAMILLMLDTIGRFAHSNHLPLVKAAMVVNGQRDFGKPNSTAAETVKPTHEDEQ